MSEVDNEFDFGFSFEEETEQLTITPNPQPTLSNDQLTALQSKIDSLLDAQEQGLQSAYVQALEEKHKAKLKELEGLILPLLYNLMKNPEKPIIKWENREPVIKKQIEKIIAVTRG
mgnify:CR=1 FL=1|jgi:hypothetical protein